MRLGFEKLEPRIAAAVASFDVNLFEDIGGHPGVLITGDTVEVGDTLFAEITVREHHPGFSGLQGVSLDIAWNSNVLKEVDDPFDLTSLITPNLPIAQGGTLDNEAGTLVNLSGAAFPASKVGRPIGNLTPERFALLHFQAIATGESSISMNQGVSSIATMPVSSLGSAQLDFDVAILSVVDSIKACGMED